MLASLSYTLSENLAGQLQGTDSFTGLLGDDSPVITGATP
jgi:hypothetical protein